MLCQINYNILFYRVIYIYIYIMNNGILTKNFDAYNELTNNNRNEYVNNILNEYYVYNPNTINKEHMLKSVNKKLKELNDEERQEGEENPIESIDEPVKVITNQYDTKYSQGTSMYDNRGKYFDLYNFNKNFDDYIRQQQQQRLLNEKLKLTDLSTVDSIKIKPYQLPLNKMLINIKDTWFETYDKIIQGQNPLNNFNQDNFFYMGITFIVVSLIYVMLLFFFE
jgi:hypothetical protein